MLEEDGKNIKLGKHIFVSSNTHKCFQAVVGTQQPLSKFTIDHFQLTVAADIWLKYCRYSLKHYSMNESINQSVVYLHKQNFYPSFDFETCNVQATHFLILA